TLRTRGDLDRRVRVHRWRLRGRGRLRQRRRGGPALGRGDDELALALRALARLAALRVVDRVRRPAPGTGKPDHEALRLAAAPAGSEPLLLTDLVRLDELLVVLRQVDDPLRQRDEPA